MKETNDEKQKFGRRGFMKIMGTAGLGLSLGSSACASGSGEVRDQTGGPLAQDYSIIFHNPDRELYVEGCGLIKLPDGILVAVVPVVTRGDFREKRADYNIYIVQSTDGGLNWQQVSKLPYYSAVPWMLNGKLYLFAMTGDLRASGGSEYRNDDLLLLSSEEAGESWSDPVTLFKGHFWNCHTGMVFRDNKLYWAVDDLAAGPRGPQVVCCNLASDPMNPDSWRISNSVPRPEIPEKLINSRFAYLPHKYLEPNVIDVYGKLRVMMAVKPAKQSTAGLGAILDLEDNGKDLDLRFTQFHPRPGGQLKFFILWDEESQLFWSTGNLVVDSQDTFDWWEKAADEGVYSGAGGKLGGNDRRFLMLFYGKDGMNWFQAGCVAKAGEISQSFMYATAVVDGNDLIIISRSSIDAPNQHDADHATFHRVKNFRELANLNLMPESQSNISKFGG